MKLKFQVQTKIQKPVEEVFDAVYNPEKLSGYFTTAGASGPLDEGTTVIWKFADYPVDAPVNVKKVVPNESIVLEWEGAKELMTRIEMTFEKTGAEETLIKVAESGWRETQADLDSSYQNCQGWTQMACALKAFLEHGINLRKGAYDKELIDDMMQSAKG